MITIKDIPLHDFHARHGARFVDFGGWNMPVQYTSILEEHRAVREAAGLFDVSHMGEFQVSGADAALFLDRLLVNQIAEAPDGKAIYSPMCAEDGTVVDDLIVYRVNGSDCLVCVNASNIEKDYAWFLKQAEAWGLDLSIEDQSAAYALLAIQGPRAGEILAQAGLESIGGIKRFHHQEVTCEGQKLRVCRTGYTGEDGFEIYLHPDGAEAWAQSILDVGAAYGLRLCGLGARDSLRLEAGLPLYGHEISDTITPLEAGLEWTVKFKKPDFVGKDALLRQKEEGLRHRVVHFKLEGRRIAREGSLVLDTAGHTVGHVLSGTLSPMTGSPIGSARIESDSLKEALFVDLRGHQAQLQLAKPPLHQ